MATDSGGGAKRRRVDGQEGRCEAALVEAIPVDRISALPEELRQRFLTHLSFKEAIRSGSLARGWRDLWKSRWAHRSSIEIHIRSKEGLRRELDALDGEPWPRRRLDRFSLVVDICKLRSSEFRRFLDFAAECRVEDLHVETRKTTVAEKLNFHLPPSSPLLTRLSLRRIRVSGLFYKDAQPFHALEVIRLHSVKITQNVARKMLGLCPNLLTLDLRDCDSDNFFWSHKRLVFPPKLRSVTIAECEGLSDLDRVGVPSLRSFRYSGCSRSFTLPKGAALADLHICLDDWLSGSHDISVFNVHLPDDLSGLTVLTICSNVLMGCSSLWHDIHRMRNLSSLGEQQVAVDQNPKLSNLQSLRELQFLMLELRADNLANIYTFLKTCQCPNLERIFVQLPTFICVLMNATVDEVVEEPLEIGFDNLKIVKIMNFHWRRRGTASEFFIEEGLLPA